MNLEDFFLCQCYNWINCSYLTTGSVLDVGQEMNNIQLQQLQTEEATRIRLNQTVNKLDHQVQHLTTVSLHVNQLNNCSVLRYYHWCFQFYCLQQAISKAAPVILEKHREKSLRITQEMRIYFNYILGSYKWKGKARCDWDRAEYEEPGTSWQAERGPGRVNGYVYNL